MAWRQKKETAMSESSANQFAVFGHPVEHSLSPRIHSLFGKQLGIPLQYSAVDAPAETFAARLGEFAAGGGRGANVTLPLKQIAAGFCAERSEFAARAGAVNTLSRRTDGQWRGDNTDGAGLICDLAERH